ncbi:MAG: hypothetical protein K6G56_00515 [Clostridiales bacterium]|nr:hypothetical protein [Clostridiales bacterium]
MAFFNRNTDEKSRVKRMILITFRGGRRAPAYYFDSVFMLAATFLILYLCAAGRLKSREAAAVFAAFSCGMLLVSKLGIDRERLKRHERKLRLSAENAVRERRLTLDPSLLRAKAGSDVFLIPKADELTADDLLEAVRERGLPLTVLTAAEPTKRARSLAASLGEKLNIVTPAEYFGEELKELIPVSEEETDSELAAEYGALVKKPGFDISRFGLRGGRAAKYAAVGAALMALSFFTRYPLYFRLTSSVCLGLAAVFFASKTIKAGGKTSG